MKGLRIKPKKHNKSSFIAFASNYLDLSETSKAKFLFYYLALNAIYFALLLFIIDYLPKEINDELNHNLIINLILLSVFFAFFSFIFGVIGEFLEFSSSNLQNAYIYLGLIAFTASSLTLAHLLGDMSIITGMATSGTPITGMVLFETRKILYTLFSSAVIYLIIATLTFNGTLNYAPLIENTTFYESNSLWRTLILAMVIPNIIIILSISLASVIRWKQREEEAAYLAQKDILTQANNRRQVLTLMGESIMNARINKTPLCVMMIDIDHFKKINDEHGHLAGDKVIVHVSDLIAKHLPNIAYHGRYGGEEFCIVMPYTELEQAKKTAEIIRENIEKNILNIAEKSLSLSVSIGLTKFKECDKNEHITDIADRLLFESDKAMYNVKQGGRNGIKVYQAI